jgi:hypothetical protein
MSLELSNRSRHFNRWCVETVTFNVTYNGHTYQAKMDERYGYFFMSNGPDDWRVIRYNWTSP